MLASTRHCAELRRLGSALHSKEGAKQARRAVGGLHELTYEEASWRAGQDGSQSGENVSQLQTPGTVRSSDLVLEVAWRDGSGISAL
jgi:hypothetical protein